MTWAGVVVGSVVAGGLAYYFSRAATEKKRFEALDAKAQKLGQHEPVSLHPRIDEHTCICTSACISVCPEKDVIGMVDGRPKLIRPSACIGHGECQTACPVNAITLVLGTEKRGVDLPRLGGDFQTNVPGLYIAGELGGMGLIHNAVNQGTQAVKAIAKGLKEDASGRKSDDLLDLLVVGAGPAGIGAGLQAQALGLRFAVVDQDSMGGALRSFPRQKIVMTAPCELPLYGKVQLRRTTKEALLELWEGVVQKTAIPIEEKVRVNDLKRGEDGVFTVDTSTGVRRARRVLLAIGRRGAPRKLGVPGEELPFVTYKLIEPEQYRGTRCAVFGGGDSAVETALILSREPGTTVTLIHRGEAFDRCKPDNAAALDRAYSSKQLELRKRTTPTEIQPGVVVLRDKRLERLPVDYIFVCIGGELPTAWLSKIGIEVTTLRGEAHPAMQQS